MEKKTIFTGAATALITPLNEKGVDFDALRKLVDWQIEQGIDALVICGTTGEASTLSDAEHKEVLRVALEAAEAHGNTQRAAVEDLKLEALADVLVRFHARKEG